MISIELAVSLAIIAVSIGLAVSFGFFAVSTELACFDVLNYVVSATIF